MLETFQSGLQYHPIIIEKENSHTPIEPKVAFKTWCFKNSLTTPSLQQPNITHLLLDGGKLYVPDARYREFLVKYTENLYSKQAGHLYLCEKKSDPLFIMMTEFDIKYPRALEQKELHCIISSIQSALRSLLLQYRMTDEKQEKPPSMESTRALRECVDFMDDEINMSILVFVADCKKESDVVNSSCQVKTGIHLVWPGLGVNKKTAWLLRATILHQLLQDSADNYILTPSNGWLEAYDPAVLKENGLRMMGSHKAEPCSLCKGKRLSNKIERYINEVVEEAFYGNTASFSGVCKLLNPNSHSPSVCKKCQGRGKIDTARPYSYYSTFDQFGEVDEGSNEIFIQDPVALLAASSIRITNSNKDVVKEICLTSLLTSSQLTVLQQKARLYEHTYTNRVNDDELASGQVVMSTHVSTEATNRNLNTNILDGVWKNLLDSHKTVSRVPDSSNIFETLSNYITNSYSDKPQVVCVKKSVLLTKEVVYFVAIKSHWCDNKQGEHSHSTNYFTISQKGCKRRCWSPKTPQNSSVACREWSSQWRPLNVEVGLLFTENDRRTSDMVENKKLSPILSPVSCLMQRRSLMNTISEDAHVCGDMPNTQTIIHSPGRELVLNNFVTNTSSLSLPHIPSEYGDMKPPLDSNTVAMSNLSLSDDKFTHTCPLSTSMSSFHPMSLSPTPVTHNFSQPSHLTKSLPPNSPCHSSESLESLLSESSLSDSLMSDEVKTDVIKTEYEYEMLCQDLKRSNGVHLSPITFGKRCSNNTTSKKRAAPTATRSSQTKKKKIKKFDGDKILEKDIYIID